MRTVQGLLKDHDVVWVYLENKETGRQFIRQARDEGFCFTSGKVPDEDDWGYVMAIHKDKTLAHLSTTVWVMSFQMNVPSLPPRVNYAKYAAGNEDYICKTSGFSGVIVDFRQV